MKLKKCIIPILTLGLTFPLFGCGKSTTTTKSTTTQPITTNGEFDNLGGGKEGSSVEASDISSKEQTIDEVVKTLEKTDITEYDLSNATPITSGGSIASSGTYLLSGTINLTEAINFTKKATDVHLIIKDATINITDDKAISSKNDLEITFIGENSITNSLGEANSNENLIKCGGNLTINGSGNVTLSSTKSAIKVDGLCNMLGANMTINALRWRRKKLCSQSMKKASSLFYLCLNVGYDLCLGSIMMIISVTTL